jgi:nucleotide-binding universal stress UspA family protein
MKILIAVDGSEYTKRMLAYVAAHDEWLGTAHQYTVLTVVPALPPRAAAILDRDLIESYYNDEAEGVFAPIRTFFTQGKMTAEFVRRVGPAADTIAKTADEGRFNLLIMGTHGHGTLGNLVMGSTATRVIAQSRVPVLLVR